MIIDSTKVYSALKKCNDIGKQLGHSSYYVLINGMIMYYPFPDDPRLPGHRYYSEHDIGLSVGFLSDSLTNALELFNGLPLFIDGTEFYRMDKENGRNFKRIEVEEDCIRIVYDTVKVDSSDMIDNFVRSATERGFTEKDITDVISTQMCSDIDLMDYYITYKQEYSGTKKTIEEKLVIPTVCSEGDWIIDNMIQYKERVKEFFTQHMIEKPILPETLKRIFDSEKPMVMKFDFDPSVGGQYRLRLMKSLFTTATAKSDVSVRVAPIDGKYLFQNIIIIRHKEFTVCHSYRSINY